MSCTFDTQTFQLTQNEAHIKIGYPTNMDLGLSMDVNSQIIQFKFLYASSGMELKEIFVC